MSDAINLNPIKSLEFDLENAYRKRSFAFDCIKEYTEEWMKYEKAILDIQEAIEKLKRSCKK